MPSASASAPMLPASWMIVVAMAFACELPGMSRTKARSILSVETGISVRRLSDEWPVPKSSMASLTPWRCRSCRIGWVRSGSVMALDSLTSTTIWLGSSPLARMVPSSRSAASGCQRAIGRLSAVRMSSWPSTHGRDARHTSSMTQSEIAVMRSVRSASGMNADGASSPSSGWSPADQGLHADHAHVLEAQDRLVVQHELASLEGELHAGREREVRRCRRAPPRLPGGAAAESSFDRYMAASARRSSASRVVASSG